jgi:hypothetical protein
MATNSSGEDILPAQALESDSVTREDVQARARELALIDGRPPSEVSQSEYEQAKRELTGESDLDRQQAMLDALPEEMRDDPEPESIGYQVPDQIGDDEDEEGRSESEQRAEKGVAQAEHDQVLQAAIEAAKSDKQI